MESTATPETLTAHVEMPQVGEHLVFNQREHPIAVYFATRKGDGSGYETDLGYINPDNWNQGAKSLNVDLNSGPIPPTYLEKMTPGQLRQARAEAGTGPGGSKSPTYYSPSSERPSGPSVTLREVVAVQQDDEGKPELVVRFVGGPAELFPGGTRDRNHPVSIGEIKGVDGMDAKQYFQDHPLIISGDRLPWFDKKTLQPEQPARKGFWARFRR
jgi:hypothetical protein